jgi:hypothetical protein
MRRLSGAWPAGGRLGVVRLGGAARLRRGVANGRLRRILVVAARSGEGPFTN